MTLTLKRSPKVKIFGTYKLRKTVKGEGQPKCHIQNVKVKGQAKGQIHLIGYNFSI